MHKVGGIVKIENVHTGGGEFCGVRSICIFQGSFTILWHQSKASVEGGGVLLEVVQKITILLHTFSLSVRSATGHIFKL